MRPFYLGLNGAIVAKDFDLGSVRNASIGDEFIIEGGIATPRKEVKMAAPAKRRGMPPVVQNDTIQGARVSDADPALFGEALHDDPDEALIAALTELGESASDAVVTAYRIDPVKRVDVHLFARPVDEFMAMGLDGLCREYGTGDYRIKVWSRGSGKIYTHRKVSLEAPKSASLPAAALSSESFGPRDMIAFMTSQQNQMMQAVQGIAAAMAGRPQGEQLGMKDVISLIGVFQQAKGGGESLGLKDILALISTAKDIVGERPTGANEFDLMGKLVEKLGGPILEAVKKKEAETPQPQLPAPKPAASEISAADDDAMMLLRMALKTLIESARAESDVDTYANMVLDHAPHAQVKTFLDDPKWFENICNMNAGAKPYAAWFTSLRERVLALIAEESASDTMAGAA